MPTNTSLVSDGRCFQLLLPKQSGKTSFQISCLDSLTVLFHNRDQVRSKTGVQYLTLLFSELLYLPSSEAGQRYSLQHEPASGVSPSWLEFQGCSDTCCWYKYLHLLLSCSSGYKWTATLLYTSHIIMGQVPATDSTSQLLVRTVSPR